MGLDAVPGRITLSVTSLLALVTQFSALRKELPPVSYVNVITQAAVSVVVYVARNLLAARNSFNLLTPRCKQLGLRLVDGSLHDVRIQLAVRIFRRQIFGPSVQEETATFAK